MVLAKEDSFESGTEFRVENVVEDWVEGGVEVAKPEEDGVEEGPVKVEDCWEENGQEERHPAEEKSWSDYR